MLLRRHAAVINPTRDRHFHRYAASARRQQSPCCTGSPRSTTRMMMMAAGKKNRRERRYKEARQKKSTTSNRSAGPTSDAKWLQVRLTALFSCVSRFVAVNVSFTVLAHKLWLPSQVFRRLASSGCYLLALAIHKGCWDTGFTCRHEHQTLRVLTSLLLICASVAPSLPGLIRRARFYLPWMGFLTLPRFSTRPPRSKPAR